MNTINAKNSIIKIMIVEDHILLIDSLKSLLGNVKFIKVECEASNGKEAIEMLNTRSVDVIIMDIDLPVMNGMDATRIITNNYPDVKVLALTSFSELAIVKKMLNSGASGYILKNVTKDILIEAIVKVYNSENFYSSEIEFLLLKPTDNKIEVETQLNNTYNSLTKREKEILKLITLGLSNKEISRKLFISEKTVKVHRENIMNKLNIHNVVSLVKFAIDNNIIN